MKIEYLIVILLILILYAIDKGKTIKKVYRSTLKIIEIIHKRRYWFLTYAVMAGIVVVLWYTLFPIVDFVIEFFTLVFDDIIYSIRN